VNEQVKHHTNRKQEAASKRERKEEDLVVANCFLFASCFAYSSTVKMDATSKSKLSYDRQSVGQSVLVSGTHLGPATNFSFSLKFSLDSRWFVIL
jgi:hypothetical protein